VHCITKKRRQFARELRPIILGDSKGGQEPYPATEGVAVQRRHEPDDARVSRPHIATSKTGCSGGNA
jgi:hypothetical protein